MRNQRLVIFDAFNTLVTARPGSQDTFLAGLIAAGLDASASLLAELQAACEGLDHSAWSGARQAYVDWATDTLSKVGQAGGSIAADLAPRVVPALEQLHQAPMVPLPGAAACLRTLKAHGFAIAVCSNWGWDLREDLEATGLTADIDVFVTSAQAGWRKPHPWIYQSTLDFAGFSAADAVFVGDSLRTDVLGPQGIGIRSVLLAPAPVEGFEGERAGSLASVARLLIDGRLERSISLQRHPYVHLVDGAARQRYGDGPFDHHPSGQSRQRTSAVLSRRGRILRRALTIAAAAAIIIILTGIVTVRLLAPSASGAKDSPHSASGQPSNSTSQPVPHGSHSEQIGHAIATQRPTSAPGSSSHPTSGTSRRGSPPATAPAVPTGITVAAVGKNKIKIMWAKEPTATGFKIENECSDYKCIDTNESQQTVGAVRSVTLSVTPGTYHCFSVQALNKSSASGWSTYECAALGITVSAAQQWIRTHIRLKKGEVVTIEAFGLVDTGQPQPLGPGGKQSCVPDLVYRSANPPFLSKQLACWSLIARVGHRLPFEVGTSKQFVTGPGQLYLSVNDSDFSDNSGEWIVNIVVSFNP